METELNPTKIKGDGRMPYDENAEKSVISAMMMSEDALQDGLMDLSADDFFIPKHRTLFSTMRRMFDNGQSIDPVSLADVLRSGGELEKCGGTIYLMDLMGSPLNLMSWQAHADIVRRDATFRRMIVASTQITAMAYEAPDDERGLLDSAERLIMSVTDRRVGSAYSSIGEVMEDLYRDLASDDPEGMSRSVKTGFPGIDSCTLGFRGGQMIVVGARPGVGKTSLCLNMAVNAARQDVSVALFSLEMSKLEIAQRLLSSQAGIPLTDIRAGKIRRDMWQSVIDATEQISGLDILIDDTPGTTVTEIRAKARRMLRGKDRGIVIIDYLQLLSTPSGSRSDNRATQVGEMSRGIKIMAKDLDVPVMALSQLNRTVEGRQGKRPQLSDLRESGSIEQDADVVILLDRSMTPEEAEKPDRPDEGVTDFIVAKNRSGPLTTVHTTFQADTIKFYEMDTRHE